MSKKLKSFTGSNAPTCSPSSLTPETDANEYGGTTFKHAPDTVRLVHADLARKLEIERNALAEALIEMRYSHTDKAEQMAVTALAYLENVKEHAPALATPHAETGGDK